ncbi:MAG: hypothetical protein AAF945_04980 [Actinomycetota bacterium]
MRRGPGSARTLVALAASAVVVVACGSNDPEQAGRTEEPSTTSITAAGDPAAATATTTTTKSPAAPADLPSTSAPPTEIDLTEVSGTPVADVVDIEIDDWVMPTWLPEGVVPYTAFLAGTDFGRITSLGPYDGFDPTLRIWLDGDTDSTPEPNTEIDGLPWYTNVDDEFAYAFRHLQAITVYVRGEHLDAGDLRRVIDGLVVVSPADLPIEVAGSQATHHTVFESDGVSLSVAGGTNGWYSTSVTTSTSGGGTGAPGRFFPWNVVQVAGAGGGSGDDREFATEATGFARDGVATVEVLWADGETSVVAPTDSSGRYADRFWALTRTVAKDSPVLSSLDPIVELRAFDDSGAEVGRWTPESDEQPMERIPIEPPTAFRSTNDLVVERRLPTDDERDGLDDEGDEDASPLACDRSEVGVATSDYGPIGPDDPKGRTSDDALRDAIADIGRDLTGTVELAVDLDSGWTEWWFGPGDSTFVWTVDEPLILVDVGGDPDLGVWRNFSHAFCVSIYQER